MEGSILALLNRHESLGFDQIVAHLAEPANAVRSALTDLRDSGFVGVLSVGETEGNAKGTFEPGWRWSEHVKPIAQTDSCQAPHLLYVLSGRMKIVMEDGTEGEIGPGDAAHIAPGHDAWTVGDEACVAVDFGGSSNYAKRQ
jgi:quercetin dioxygenase-like cupin family protein